MPKICGSTWPGVLSIPPSSLEINCGVPEAQVVLFGNVSV